MASDFSAAWQCLSKRTIGFLLRIKLHANDVFFLSEVWRGVKMIFISVFVERSSTIERYCQPTPKKIWKRLSDADVTHPPIRT
jgi:hypothetical protein